MISEDIRELVEASDLDGLIRAVDGLAGSRDWEGIEALRDRCVEAVGRGKQLWGVAQFAEYRLALEAPAEHAGAVVVEGAGRNTLGPLWEVAASTHTWDELEPHVSQARPRALVAHERMIRGDEVDESAVDASVLDIPLRRAPWEPRYPTAEYRSDRAAFPERDLPEMPWVDLGEPAEKAAEPAGADALLDLVRVWVDESSGRAEARTVVGTAAQAIRALGLQRVRLAPISLADAMVRMAWVGASGGAYGRRRGTPVGRAGAWWAAACLVGLDDEWPMTSDELGEAAAGLKWFAWDPGDVVGGWNFHLAVEDPLDGLAWAVGAVDWK